MLVNCWSLWHLFFNQFVSDFLENVKFKGHDWRMEIDVAKPSYVLHIARMHANNRNKFNSLVNEFSCICKLPFLKVSLWCGLHSLNFQRLIVRSIHFFPNIEILISELKNIAKTLEDFLSLYFNVRVCIFNRSYLSLRNFLLRIRIHLIFQTYCWLWVV